MEREELLALGIEESVAEKILEEQEKLIEEYDNKLKEEKRAIEIERVIEKSGARNITAVKALIKGEELDEVIREIENLKNDEETRFLFEKRGSFAPHRRAERLPGGKKESFEERLSVARRAGNTLEAIRIKQQAAAEGIVLL